MSEHQGGHCEESDPTVYTGSSYQHSDDYAQQRGFSWDWTEGRSFDAKGDIIALSLWTVKEQPFCDGTHEKVGFEGKETEHASLTQDKQKIDDQLSSERRGTTLRFRTLLRPRDRVWGAYSGSDSPEPAN